MVAEKGSEHSPGRRALVVDNQQMVLRLMGEFLEQEGYEVRTAADGLAALEVLGEGFVPEVMFVDLIMPLFSGDKLCQVVRSMPVGREMFIVVLSGIAAEEAVDFAAFGADACIAKGPFKTVKKHIRALLSNLRQGRRSLPPRQVLGLDGIYKREITQELLISKKHFEIILRNIVEGIVELKEESRIVFANAAAVNLIGRREEELIAHRFLELFTGENRELVARALAGLGEKPLELGEEQPVLLGDRRLLLYFLPLVDASGPSTIVIMRDITLRKQAEEKLLASRQQLENMVASRTAELAAANQELRRQIAERRQAEEQRSQAEREWARTFDAIGDVVTLHDTEMRIIRANRAACRLLGASEQELVGRYCYQVFRHQATPCPECPETRAVREGRTVTAEITHPPLGRTFMISAAPICNDAGECTAIAHFARDITDQKKLEFQLRQAQKMEAIGTLAGGIAHDFNNILGAVMGYAELALLDVDQDQPLLRERLEAVMQAGQRARDLVGQILAFSRQGEEQREPLELAPVVKEALKLLRGSLPANIEIRAEIGGGGGERVLANPVQVHQVLMNLCTNAFHAMQPRGGVLTVRLEKVELEALQVDNHPELRPGPYLCLMVSDTGCGMDGATVSRIFDPFFTTKPVGTGTGMGLSVTHGIVQEHGGAITVESVLGKGSTFRVYLPLLTAAADAAAEQEAMTLPVGDERLLLVDDEPALVRLGEEMLGRLGYRVTGVVSAAEALRLVQATPDGFDLVITDLTMPGFSGLELAEAILATRPDLPVVLCTGYSEMDIEQLARAVGIRACLRKPLLMSELARTVRQALGRREDG